MAQDHSAPENDQLLLPSQDSASQPKVQVDPNSQPQPKVEVAPQMAKEDAAQPNSVVAVQEEKRTVAVAPLNEDDAPKEESKQG